MTRAKKKAAKPKQPAGPKVVKSAMTIIRFQRHGRTAELIVRPTNNLDEDSREGVVTIIAPCGDELTLPKAVALAAANAVIETASGL